MSTVPKHFIAPEEYLYRERDAEFRSEYFRGEMLAMAGASANHNLTVQCRCQPSRTIEEETLPSLPERFKTSNRINRFIHIP